MAGPIRISILANGRQARAELERTGVTAGAMGKNVARLGKIMAGAFAIDAIAHGAAELIHLSTSFESSMTRIQTQAGASAADVEKLSKSVLALGGKVQQSPEELANSLYHLKSVGLDNVKAMQALKASSQFAAVGNADLEETTNALAGTWRSGIKGAGSFKQAIATLNAVIGAGNMSMGDLNEAIGTGFLPSARSFGLGLKDVGSALAVLTDEGIPANVAATRLRMSFSLLGAPSKQAAGQLDTIGLSAKSLAVEMRKGGLVGAIGLLKDHLKGLSQVDQAQLLSHAFGGGRSSSAILTLINNFDVLEQKERQIANTAGLQRFSNSVAAQSETAAAKIAKFKSALETLGTQAGKPLAGELASLLTPLTRDLITVEPKLVALGHEVHDDLGPAFSAVSKTIGDYVKALGGATSGGSSLLAVLKPIGDTVEVVAKGLDAIPGPLKSFGIEALIAARILPSLRAGVTSVTTSMKDQITYARVLGLEMKDVATSQRLTAAQSARLGTALKTAAGVGGMLALSGASSQTDDSIRTLMNVAGAAALGFSVGGPWGAAIGGAAGLMTDLTSSTSQQNAAMRRTGDLEHRKAVVDSLASSLGKLSGKTTAATRATIVQEITSTQDGRDALRFWVAAGVSQKTYVDAVLGLPKASGVMRQHLGELKTFVGLYNKAGGSIDNLGRTDQKRLRALAGIFGGQISGTKEGMNILQQYGGAYKKLIGEVADGEGTWRQQQLLTKGFVGSLKGLPKNVRVFIKANNLNGTVEQAERLARRFKGLNNSELKVLLKAEGIPATRRNLALLATDAHRVGRQASTALNGVDRTAGTAGQHSGSNFLRQLVTTFVHGQPRATSSLQRLIAGAAVSATGPAKAGGAGVGRNVAFGVAGGISSGGGIVNSAATSLINNALASMRSAAKIHSPSRVSMAYGAYLGQGLALGLESTHATLRLAGANAASQAIAGMQTPALDLHRAQLTRKAKPAAAQGRQVFELRLDDGTPLRGYVHRHARDAAREEIDQADVFWTGRG